MHILAKQVDFTLLVRIHIRGASEASLLPDLGSRMLIIEVSLHDEHDF